MRNSTSCCRAGGRQRREADRSPSFPASPASASRAWSFRCASGFTDEPKAIVSYACSPHHVNSALFPFIAQLERSAGFAPMTPRRHASSRLESLSAGNRGRTRRRGGALCRSAWHSGRFTAARLTAMSPLQKKGLLFRTFLAQLEGLAVRARCSWCWKMRIGSIRHRVSSSIRSSIAFSACRCSLSSRSGRILSPPWIGFPHVTLLTLNRLTQAQARSVGRAGRPEARRCPPRCLSRSWRGRKACRSSPRNSPKPCSNPDCSATPETTTFSPGRCRRWLYQLHCTIR